MKNIRKLLSLVLFLCILACSVPVLGEAAPEADGIPAAGDVVEGFEVKEVRFFPLLGCPLVYMEHQRTGAKVLYIACDDTNRVFQLTFRTRMADDTGLPHVFEHATLSGSAKYPSTSLFMSLNYQTYNTYMNAYTADAITSYPIASLSEEQLLKLADVYTDMCLNPIIMTDESIYRTEAWRYEMTDMDAPLTLNGTVYSEMLGAYNLSRAGLIAANKVTFPGASISHDYGGVPAVIPEMTWDQLKEYHNTYYHPSNALAILYGDFSDYTAFLKMLDEAFAPFDRKEINLEETEYARITEPAVTTCSYPMAEGTDPTGQTAVYYYILCPGMKGDTAEEALVDHACELLGSSSSPLMLALKKTFPTASFSVGREVAAPDDAILIMATGMNEGDADLFRETVDTSMRLIAEEGFSADLVDQIVTDLKFNAKLASETGNPVEGIVYNFAYDYGVTGNVFAYAEDYAAMDSIEAEFESGAITGAIAKWLVDPALFTLTTAVPAPGAREAEDAALAEKLAGIKAGMSTEEKEAIVAATNTEPEAKDDSAIVAELTAVTVATLPEEIREYEIHDSVGEDGVRRIEAVTGVDGISYIGFYLDAATLPQEDIHYMRLFTRLLGHMDTDRHTWEELESKTARYLYSSTFGVSVSGWKDNCHPYLVAEWYALDEDLETGYSLAEEILFHTDFTNTDLLLERVQAQKTAVRATINNDAYWIIVYRQLGISCPRERYYSYLNHLEYYAFLVDTEAQLEKDPAPVVARLEALKEFFHNRSGAVLGLVGCEDSLALNRPLADAFFAGLDDIAREPVEYSFPVPAKREAIIVDGNIQFNSVAASWTALDPAVSGPEYEPFTSLVADQLLMPIMRDQMGSYGAIFNSEQNMLYLFSYRDPNLAETFAFYDTLPDRIAALAADQETLDRYIISSYSRLAQPDGEFTGAVNAVNNRISGIPDDIVLTEMRALKSVTPEGLVSFAAYVADLLNTGIRGTIGSAAAIGANAEMFEAVLNPFNVQDLSEATFSDVAEGAEHYESVTYCISNGLMIPKSETEFGTEDEATVGDFFAGIYVLVGGPNADAQACLDLLAANGLADPATDLNAPLAEQAACDLLTVLGVPLTTDTPDHVLTRGELADLFQMLSEE